MPLLKHLCVSLVLGLFLETVSGQSDTDGGGGSGDSSLVPYDLTMSVSDTLLVPFPSNTASIMPALTTVVTITPSTPLMVVPITPSNTMLVSTITFLVSPSSSPTDAATDEFPAIALYAGVPVAGLVILLVLLSAVICCCWYRRKKRREVYTVDHDDIEVSKVRKLEETDNMEEKISEFFTLVPNASTGTFGVISNPNAANEDNNTENKDDLPPLIILNPVIPTAQRSSIVDCYTSNTLPPPKRSKASHQHDFGKDTDVMFESFGVKPAKSTGNINKELASTSDQLELNDAKLRLYSSPNSKEPKHSSSIYDVPKTSPQVPVDTIESGGYVVISKNPASTEALVKKHDQASIYQVPSGLPAENPLGIKQNGEWVSVVEVPSHYDVPKKLLEKRAEEKKALADFPKHLSHPLPQDFAATEPEQQTAAAVKTGGIYDFPRVASASKEGLDQLEVESEGLQNSGFSDGVYDAARKCELSFASMLQQAKRERLKPPGQPRKVAQPIQDGDTSSALQNPSLSDHYGEDTTQTLSENEGNTDSDSDSEYVIPPDALFLTGLKLKPEASRMGMPSLNEVLSSDVFAKRNPKPKPRVQSPPTSTGDDEDSISALKLSPVPKPRKRKASTSHPQQVPTSSNPEPQTGEKKPSIPPKLASSSSLKQTVTSDASVSFQDPTSHKESSQIPLDLNNSQPLAKIETEKAVSYDDTLDQVTSPPLSDGATAEDGAERVNPLLAPKPRARPRNKPSPSPQMMPSDVMQELFSRTGFGKARDEADNDADSESGGQASVKHSQDASESNTKKIAPEIPVKKVRPQVKPKPTEASTSVAKPPLIKERPNIKEKPTGVSSSETKKSSPPPIKQKTFIKSNT